MTKQLTVRGISAEVATRLKRLSRAQKKSVNAIIVGILEQSVDVKARRRQLERYATWTETDLAEFSDALRDQRQVDEELWN